MKKTRRPLLLAASLGLLLGLVNVSFAQVRHSIRGEVLDNGNRPIVGVLVRIYRGNRKAAEDIRTTSDGSYNIPFYDGEPITLVRYDHTDWRTETIEYVSGKRDQVINKVLNQFQTISSNAEQQRYVATLERLYQLDKANGVSDEEFRATYSKQIEKAKIPDEMLAGLPFKEAPLPGTEKYRRDILETAKANGKFTIFIKAVEKAGLEELLRRGEFTVFAPTDEAFGRLPKAVLDSLLNNPALLRKYLLSYISPAEVKGESTTGKFIYSIQPREYPKTAAESFWIPERDIGWIQARSIISVAPASNGILYGINAPLNMPAGAAAGR